MKKLLALLGVVSLGITGTSTVVACGGSSDDGIKNYGLNTDTVTVLEDVVSKQAKEDIADYVDKKLTYDEFFHIPAVSPQDYKDANFLEDFLYSAVREGLKEVKNGENQKYTSEEINAQVAKVLEWSKDAVTLAYFDAKDIAKPKEDQIFIKSITKEEAGNKRLEKIFLDEVMKYNDVEEADIQNPDFWTEHTRATVGIKFNKKQGNVSLGEKVEKDWWTFTFITE